MEYFISKWKLKGDYRFYSEDAMYIRSMLGFHLHKECCLFDKRDCKECSLCDSCMYSTLFDSFSSERERGDRPSRPFRLSIVNGILNIVAFSKEEAVNNLIIEMVRRAGADGIGSRANRRMFEIEEISNEQRRFDYLDSSSYEGVLALYFRTPARFKERGVYTSDVNSQNLYGFMRRRFIEISEILGCNSEELPYEDDSCFMIIDDTLRWKEWERYSARQKARMTLGGVEGFLMLEGYFSQRFMALLDFCSIAGIGKNTALGLGELTYLRNNNE